MPYYAVQPRLLLGYSPAVLNGAVSCLGDGFFFDFKSEIIGALHLCQLRPKSLIILLRAAQSFLHIAAPCPGTIFVVAIGTEHHPHGADIFQDILRLHSLANLDPHLRIWPDATGTVHIELAIRPCHEAQITHGGMGLVLWGAGKADFIFTRHLLRVNKLHGILTYSLCIRHHIEILVCINA